MLRKYQPLILNFEDSFGFINLLIVDLFIMEEHFNKKFIIFVYYLNHNCIINKIKGLRHSKLLPNLHSNF